MPLGRDEVAIWVVDLAAAGAAQAHEPILAPAERARADRFATADLRRRFVVARGALRRLAAAELGADPAALRFEEGEHGKPELAGASELAFNVSHAGEVALVALAHRRAVGVDVEALARRPASARLVRRVLAPEEAAAVEAAGAGRDELFLRYWTAKEAFVKAHGAGLGYGLERVRVALRDDGALAVAGAPADPGPWQARSLAPRPGYVGAVVAQGEALALRERPYFE